MKKILKVVTSLSALFVLAACGDSSEETIQIGHKNFTEQRVLGQLYATMIEHHTDYDMEVTEFGGTSLVFEALNSDEIDLYGSYTGTLYATILKQAGETNPETVYDIVKDGMEAEYGIAMSESLGFNNTYTFSVPEEIAKQYHLETFSDLAEVSNELRLGVDLEFLEREDGLPGATKVYEFDFADAKSLDPGIRYTALENGDVDVINAYSTDGKILEYNLTVLEDDKQFFPPYYGVTIYKDNFLEEYPEASDAVSMLDGQISDEEMQQMNYLVDEEGQPEQKVAEDFLREKGLID